MIQVIDDVVVHLLPWSQPLIADSGTGILLGRGTQRSEKILATQIKEVQDAFKGNNEKVRRRGTMWASNGNNIKHGNFTYFYIFVAAPKEQVSGWCVHLVASYFRISACGWRHHQGAAGRHFGASQSQVAHNHT